MTSPDHHSPPSHPAGQMADNARQASAFLKKLANEHRLMILCALVEREMSVGELNALVPLSQSALSQHLAGLRTAGLVNTRRQGQTIFYAIADPAVLAVIQLLHDQFCPDGVTSTGEQS